MWPFGSEGASSQEEDSAELRKALKKKLREILARAKRKHDEIEEEWRDPTPPDLVDVSYYVDDDEQDEPEAVPAEKKEPRPYRSYAEVVLDEVEKEAR